MAILRPHHLAALALALLLGGVWTMQDWSALSQLTLPDTDDVMRLQQVRDWLAGQAFGDVTQYRLGPPGGTTMHWSRIGDLVPAALIRALSPYLGRHWAEVAAVIAWPIAQFALLIALVGSIAGRIEPAARGPAMILAALAYPASALFAPGRIDHHALQVLLVLVQLRALVAAPTLGSGLVAGLSAAVGATIGLETVPFALVTGAIVALGGGWRQGGFGLAVALGLVALTPLVPQGATCDTIRPLLLPVIAAGAAMAATAALGRLRLPVLAALGIAIAVFSRSATATCAAGPYGAVDPLVARLWLAQVEEARPLLHLPLAEVVSYAGLMLAGLAAGLALAIARRCDWIVVAIFQLASLAIALSQLRGVYVGTAIAALPIAALLADARAAHQGLRVAALWIAGAGMIYPLAAAALASKPVERAETCDAPALRRALATLGRARVMAPIDLGPRALAATQAAFVAGPYHRDLAGIAAMYRFYLGPAHAARRIAAQVGTDAVVLCDHAFDGLPMATDSIAAGARPTWLVPMTHPVANAPLFMVDAGLSDRPSKR